MPTKTTNILDEVHAGLDPRVFDNPDDAEPRLKPHHRAWIEDKVHRTLEKAGYEQIDSWLSLVLTGSLTTYQYSDDSDVDISLFVDVNHFPEWSRAEMIGVLVDNVDGTTLPGTPHPMQCFVVPPDVTREQLYQPGLRSGYDLDKDEWIVPPDHDRVHDVQVEMNGMYVYALECADKMERLLRYEPDKAVTYWHQIHKRRQRDQKAGKGDYSESNIVYKMLNNRGLMPLIAETSGEYIAKTADMIPGDEEDVTDIIGQHAYDEWQFSDDPTLESLYEAHPELKGKLGSVRNWAIDPIALDKAGYHMGFKHPVQVIPEGTTHGQYQGLSNGTHQILAVPWLRPESANQQIWHELVHARQAEGGMDFPERPESYDDYRAQPHEVEAHDFEAPFSVVRPLVTSNAEGLSDDTRNWDFTPTETQQEIDV